MTTLPLTEVKTKLNELIETAVTTHERVTITRHGKPAAVLISSAKHCAKTSKAPGPRDAAIIASCTRPMRTNSSSPSFVSRTALMLIGN